MIGNKADWELKAIKRAYGVFELLNTPEENKMLQATRMVLNDRNRRKKENYEKQKGRE
jgi:hypothetical protein